MNIFFSSLVALPIFVALDFLWLGIIMRSFYVRELGPLARQGIHYPSAFVVYVLMALSVVVFVLPRFFGMPVTLKVFALGALLGFLIYGIYDFTNYATLAHWSWRFMVVDILWGGVVYGVTSILTLSILRWLKIFS